MARDSRLDGLKFLMIFLVVIGHLGYRNDDLLLNRMIYSFHMPVFIFLSGYFTSRKDDREKHLKWLKQTLILYVCAQLGHVLLKLSMDYATCAYNNKPFEAVINIKSIFIHPNFALWYLVCLMYWRLSVWTIFKKINDIKLLIISIVLAIASGVVPLDHEFSFQRAFAFYPFFVLGLMFRERNLMHYLEQVKYGYAIIVLILCIIISRHLPTYMPKFHYGNWHHTAYRVVQSLLGLVLCLSVVRLSRFQFTEKFAKWGTYTLWIYVGHTYLALISQRIMSELDYHLNFVGALLLATFYCAFFIGMAKLYHRLKFGKQKNDAPIH